MNSNQADAELPCVIIIDDDEGHCELIRRHFNRAGLMNPVEIFHDADSALSYFTTSDAVCVPRLLLLLDIKMPGTMDGIALLEKLKRMPEHKAMPVFMLSTTEDPREIRRCYEAGCSAYVTKPVQMEDFREVITRLVLFISIMRVD